MELPELEKVMEHSIYASIPNDYQRLNEAYSQPRLLDPTSDLGIEMGKLAAKLAGVNAEKRRAANFLASSARRSKCRPIVPLVR